MWIRCILNETTTIHELNYTYTHFQRESIYPFAAELFVWYVFLFAFARYQFRLTAALAVYRQRFVFVSRSRSRLCEHHDTRTHLHTSQENKSIQTQSATEREREENKEKRCSCLFFRFFWRSTWVDIFEKQPLVNRKRCSLLSIRRKSFLPNQSKLAFIVGNHFLEKLYDNTKSKIKSLLVTGATEQMHVEMNAKTQSTRIKVNTKWNFKQSATDGVSCHIKMTFTC